MYFDEKHAPVFFGREQERDTVIKQLKENIINIRMGFFYLVK